MLQVMSGNTQVFLASAWVMSANIPLAEASPMARLRDRVGGVSLSYGKGMDKGQDEHWGLDGSNLLQRMTE